MRQEYSVTDKGVEFIGVDPADGHALVKFKEARQEYWNMPIIIRY